MTKSKNNQKGPVVLVILDGWGEWNIVKGNAIANAKLPTIDNLNKYYPKLSLQASGLAVGLPWATRGNSEVGHQSMGTGQIIFQHLPIISMAIKDGSFKENQTLLRVVSEAKKNKTNLHLIGLISDGSVHSHIDHLVALLPFIKNRGPENVFIHAITDGRDTAPKSAKKYLEIINKAIAETETGQIATILGRHYAMDRNNNWDRTAKVLSALVNGDGLKESDPLAAIGNQYKRKITDEFIEPVIIVDKKEKPIGLIKENDTVICFNFRRDRTRQLAKGLSDPNFKKIKMPKINFCGFIEYEKELKAETVFPEKKISARVGEVISRAGMKQLRVAETEKFAHVTYFFNGGLEKAFPKEDRISVLSKIVDNYAKVPEMSAEEITQKSIAAIEKKNYDFILINYANPDMVGHTGDFKAGIKAVEFTDLCLAKLIKAVFEKEGYLLVTADHGNVEEMINLTTLEKDTEHSTNPVPCWLVSPNYKKKATFTARFSSDMDGMIVDIASTVLELLGLKKPNEMMGRSLLSSFKLQL